MWVTLRNGIIRVNIVAMLSRLPHNFIIGNPTKSTLPNWFISQFKPPQSENCFINFLELFPHIFLASYWINDVRAVFWLPLMFSFPGAWRIRWGGWAPVIIKRRKIDMVEEIFSIWFHFPFFSAEFGLFFFSFLLRLRKALQGFSFEPHASERFEMKKHESIDFSS